MKPVSFQDYFGISNRWTRRLLGIDTFSVNRSVEKVESEYNQDKYKRLLECSSTDIETVKRTEWENNGVKMKDPFIISFGNELFETTVQGSRDQFRLMLTSIIHDYAQGKNLCELGCGYGYNLSFFPEYNTYGGEYSSNAVAIGQRCGMNVKAFNYYEDKDYDLIVNDSTVFTCHSLEQIPDASHFVQALRKRKDKVNVVIHMEPTVVPERNDLFGVMRNRYMEINDYNRNLLELLRNSPDIEIVKLEMDVLGLNPLNSSNLIVWKFKK